MNGSYKQGFYQLKNPDKYIENTCRLDPRPFFRSSYEERLFVWADLNQNVVKWCSECIVIKYKMMDWVEKLGKFKEKEHKYYTDLYCEIKDNEGKIVKYLIEIKPYKQTLEPKKPLKKTTKANRNYLTEQAIYQKNTAKWNAARNYCKEHGILFKLLTDKDIFK